jgi:hypothetical protein
MKQGIKNRSGKMGCRLIRHSKFHEDISLTSNTVRWEKHTDMLQVRQCHFSIKPGKAG